MVKTFENDPSGKKAIKESGVDFDVKTVASGIWPVTNAEKADLQYQLPQSLTLLRDGYTSFYLKQQDRKYKPHILGNEQRGGGQGTKTRYEKGIAMARLGGRY